MLCGFPTCLPHVLWTGSVGTSCRGCCEWAGALSAQDILTWKYPVFHFTRSMEGGQMSQGLVLSKPVFES